MTKKTDQTIIETKDDPSILRRYRTEVSVDLDHDEVEAYGRKLAAEKKGRDLLIQKAKDVATEYKGQIATKTSEIDRLANAINTGAELRSTEVYDKLEGSQVRTYRQDGDVFVTQRPAGFADEQTNLFAEPDAEESTEGVPEFPTPPAPPARKKRGPGRKKKPAAN